MTATMTILRPHILGLLSLVLSASQPSTTVLGPIDFFGTTGVDAVAVRAALPVKPGDPISEADFDRVKQEIVAAVQRVAGRPPTDFGGVCCTAEHHLLLFIGLPGRNSQMLPENTPPDGSRWCVPAAGVDRYGRAMSAANAAVQAGDTAEDQSRGYALSNNPAYRARQLEMRDYARAHTLLIEAALADCGSAENRQAAATLLGYADRSRAQIKALVSAARDPDGTVRNNAVRALWVLASAKTRGIPTDPFVAMLNSNTWEDRNKAGLLLMALTGKHNAGVLAQLRQRAMDSLVEMARWQDASHALAYRLLLGRMAGWDDDRTNAAIAAGHIEAVIDAARRPAEAPEPSRGTAR